MKVIILAGSPGSAIFPLSSFCPKLSLSLANRPLLIHLLLFFKKRGVSDFAVILPGQPHSYQALVDSFAGELEGVRVSFFEEKTPRGTAGALSNLKGFIGAADFMVVNSNIFMNDLDIDKALKFHRSKNAGITLLVEKDRSGSDGFESVFISRAGQVENIRVQHHSLDRRRCFAPTGAYLFSPQVLDHIFDKAYMDIKEQLIPRLNEHGVLVLAYETENSVRAINCMDDYLALNKELLFDLSGRDFLLNGLSNVKDRVWVGKGSSISPDAHILGPVFIGENCDIGDNAYVIGPACIGRDTRIENGAVVRESIICEKAHLSRDAVIEYSLIGDGCAVGPGETVKKSFFIKDDSSSARKDLVHLANDGPYKLVIGNIQDLQLYKARLWHKVFLASKRLLDVFFSSLALISLSPLFFLICLIIKLDSKGPVLYRQRRCGKNGDEFTMYKFRTMYTGSDSLQQEFKKKKDVDGPMFKMANDPRITRCGGFLRKSSLDELPQMLNVLKGEMSLVGPRPLVMDEMSFAPSWRDIRLKVKPGITGLWQISGRSDVSFDEWIKNDIKYVRQQCIVLDIKIMIRTIRIALACIGAR